MSPPPSEPVVVQSPPPGADRPSWNQVGVITAIGFLLGILWPRIAGVRLGPSAPETSSAGGAASAASSASGATPPPTVAPPAVASASPAVSVVSEAPPAAHPLATASAATHASATAGTAPPAHAAAASTGAPSSHSVTDSGDTVHVQYEMANVRDAPKMGKLVARLPRGTPMRVGPPKDGWYPVRYGEHFGSEGWVYHAAIGR